MAAGRQHAGRALLTVREAHLMVVVTVCYRCFHETGMYMLDWLAEVSMDRTYVELIVGFITHNVG